MESRSQTELRAGIAVSGLQIVRGGTSAEEPCLAVFQGSGRTYSCPLHVFLPRTEALPDDDVANSGVRETHVLAV